MTPLTPTVMCTNNVVRTVELGSAGVEVFYTVPTATDISGTEQIISQSQDSGDFFPVGVTVVTYIFADASGNVAPTCSFNVTVNTGKKEYAVNVQRSLAPLSWFPGSRKPTAHVHQCCRFQSYGRAEDCMPSPMKFTSEVYIAWTTFLGSTTTAPMDHVVTFDFNSVLLLP